MSSKPGLTETETNAKSFVTYTVYSGRSKMTVVKMISQTKKAFYCKTSILIPSKMSSSAKNNFIQIYAWSVTPWECERKENRKPLKCGAAGG